MHMFIEIFCCGIAFFAVVNLVEYCCTGCDTDYDRINDTLFELNTAIKNTDIHQMNTIIRNRPDIINVKTKNPPLIEAAKTSNCEVIKILLDADADIDTVDEHGNTALMVACTYCHVPSFELIMKYNPNVNKMNDQEYNPLLFAVINDNQEMVEILMDKGAINHVNKHGIDCLTVCKSDMIKKILGGWKISVLV
jgi:ankyrin repeat protein